MMPIMPAVQEPTAEVSGEAPVPPAVAEQPSVQTTPVAPKRGFKCSETLDVATQTLARGTRVQLMHDHMSVPTQLIYTHLQSDTRKPLPEVPKLSESPVLLALPVPPVVPMMSTHPARHVVRTLPESKKLPVHVLHVVSMLSGLQGLPVGPVPVQPVRPTLPEFQEWTAEPASGEASAPPELLAQSKETATTSALAQYPAPEYSPATVLPVRPLMEQPSKLAARRQRRDRQGTDSNHPANPSCINETGRGKPGVHPRCWRTTHEE